MPYRTGRVVPWHIHIHSSHKHSYSIYYIGHDVHSIVVNGQRYSDRLPTAINIIYYYYCLGLGAQLSIRCNYYSTFIIVLQFAVFAYSSIHR